MCGNKILVIDAITDLHLIDWSTISTNRNLKIEFELLPDFHLHFESGNIQKALENSKDILTKRISDFDPDLLIVHSKGVCIISFLIVENIYCGPAILLSPIINYCDHILIDDVDQYWDSIQQILASTGSKYAFGIGNSIDERELIYNDICDMCLGKDWLILLCDGDHDWILDEKCWPSIGILIDALIEPDKHTK